MERVKADKLKMPVGTGMQHFFIKYGWVFYIFAVLLVAFYYAMQRIFVVDFVPTNGDFQTYNALRRVLDGQVPYRDFANYLGVGTLLLNAPLVALHNTFAGSLFVTNFVVTVLFAALVFTVFYAVTGDKFVAAAAGLLFPQIVNGQFTQIIPQLGYYFTLMLGLLARPNNSMRMVRIFLSVLYALVFLLYTRRYAKKHGRPFDILEHVGSWKFCAVTGLAVGFGMTWSNDYGFACIGSVTILFIVFWLKAFWMRFKGIVKPFFAYLGSLLLGAFSSVLIFTLGNVSSFLKFTLGVADYQYWYFGIAARDKAHSIAEFLKQPRLAFHTVVFLCVMGWCLYRLIKGKLNNRNLVFGFLYLTQYIAALIYIYGSGGYQFYEALEGVASLTAFALIVRGTLWLAKRIWPKPTFVKGVSLTLAEVMVVYALLIGFLDARLVYSYREADIPARYDYVEQLDGALPMAYDLNAQNELIGDATLFSTYATALEVMRGDFQPTGSDYIIHVLGDEQQRAYIDDFVTGEYDYVQTPNFMLNPWESWVTRVNWEFYSILYRDYSLLYEDANWVLWERNPQGHSNAIVADVEYELLAVDEQTTEIRLYSDNTESFIVDVALDYDSEKVMNLYRLQTWKHSVHVDDPTLVREAWGMEGYYLPTEAQGRHVMVKMENGVGSISLTSLPVECTRLTVRDVRIGEKVQIVSLLGAEEAEQ